MDPVSAFGIISGGVQVVQAIASTIHGLNQLYGKFKDADLTIQSLIQELSCINTALTSLKEWTRLNSNNGLQSEEYSRDLAVAMEGCRVIMEVVSHDVSTLVQSSRDDGFAGFHARMRIVWREDTMRGHQEKLHSQVMALQLLLQVCQCHTSTEQIRLLRTATTRRIFHRVADDTATILSSRGSRATSHAGSISLSSRQSISDSSFDFQRAIAESPAYRRTLDQTALNATSLDQGQLTMPGSEHSGSFAFTDEGYASNRTETASLVVPSLQIPASGPEQEDFFPLPSSPSGPVRHPSNHLHSRSVSHTPNYQQQTPSIRRNVSDSKAQKLRSSGSKREKISSFLRMNTRSRANLAVSPGGSPNLSMRSAGSLRRRQRQEGDFTTSIDLTANSSASVPQIIKAVQEGSRDEVERLIDQGCDIEARHSRSNRNALLVAAHCGKEDVIDLLIHNHAKLNVIDRGGWTALHLSASRGHCGVLEILLAEAGDLIEVPNSHGQTALRVAANFGQLDAVYMLLSSHAQVNARGENQMTALHAAAKQGESEIIQVLISHGADLEAKDGSMMTALHHACEQGHLDSINTLLDNKAAVEARGRDHQTPLICAAEAGRSQAVKLLLERRAIYRTTDGEGMTAFHWAAYNGHEETVRILSEKKALLESINNMGRTALHLATIQSQFAVVDFLQRKGMPLDRRCKAGLTALHYACMADSFEISRLLLMTGADVEASETQHQQRPLHIAAARGSVSILELLCDMGATIDARNGVGDRPACVASRFGHVGVLQRLLDRGSPLTLKFDTGFREDSLLCLAALGGHWAVASLLIARGASIVKKDETGWPPVRYAIYYGHADILQLFLSSHKIPEANLPEIIQLPGSIGFAPDVSTDRKDEVQRLLGQAMKPHVSVPAPVPAPTSDMALNSALGLTPAHMNIPAAVSADTPSQPQQSDHAISGHMSNILPLPPSAVEAGSNTVYELPGSLDSEPIPNPNTQHTTNTTGPTSTIINRTPNPPEIRHPEPIQPLANDRIAAMLRNTHGPSTSSVQNPGSIPPTFPTRSRSQSRSRDGVPQVSATYTPVSLVYHPTPSPPVRSYAIPHRGRKSVLITPPSLDTVGTAQVPRSLPLYENNRSIALSSSDYRVGGDSDSDSITSVYTAPEGDFEREISNLSVQETLVGRGK